MLEDAQAERSHVPEIIARLVRRSRDHLTREDIEDLMELVERDTRTKERIATARKAVARSYQEA